MRFFARLFALVFFIIAAVAVLFGVFISLEKLILPQDYYFYQYHPLAEKAMIYLLVIPVVTFFGVVLGRLRRRRDEVLEDMYDLFFVWRRLGKGRLVLIALWAVCMYFCVTSATIVTKDKIICHSPMHPSGIVYNYKDVSKIHAAFGQKRFAILEYQKKGNFYYEIELGGKKKVFYTPSVNEDVRRYEDETYLELEDFDHRLVLLGIPKESSEKGWEACDLDREYVERFRRIIAFHKES